MTRMEGYTLAVPKAWFMGGIVGNIFSAAFEHAATIDSYDADPAELLLPFFEKMYDEAGQTRPQTQDGG